MDWTMPGRDLRKYRQGVRLLAHAPVLCCRLWDLKDQAVIRAIEGVLDVV